MSNSTFKVHLHWKYQLLFSNYFILFHLIQISVGSVQLIGSTFIADTRFFRLNYKQKKTVFIFRMRKKLFISISTLSIVFWFILTLRLAITPELRESKFSDDNFKFILIWKGFSDPPIRGREMSCPHQCYITENRLIFQTVGSTLIGRGMSRLVLYGIRIGGFHAHCTERSY